MTRQAPADSATLFPIGHVAVGNDGDDWQIIKTSNGIKRWQRMSNVEDYGIPKDLIAQFNENYDTKKYSETFIKYQTSPKKINFEPLTLDLIKENLGKKIHHYCSNGDDPNGPLGPRLLEYPDTLNRKKVFADWVQITSPCLTVYNPKNKKYTRHENWLNDENSFIIKKGMYLYLDGIWSFLKPGTKTDAAIQIADPYSRGKFKGIRYITPNAMNSECWVEKK